MNFDFDNLKGKIIGICPSCGAILYTGCIFIKTFYPRNHTIYPRNYYKCDECKNDITDTVENKIKQEEEMRKITKSNLVEKDVRYVEFSCKPKNKKYSPGTVFDEDKSVKWNREELDRRNNLHEQEVKNLNTTKNKMRDSLIKDIKRYIAQETKVSDEKATQIYNYLYDQVLHKQIGEKLCVLGELIDELDDLLCLFK